MEETKSNNDSCMQPFSEDMTYFITDLVMSIESKKEQDELIENIAKGNETIRNIMQTIRTIEEIKLLQKKTTTNSKT